MESVALEILMFVLSFLGVLVALVGLPGVFVPVAAALVAWLWGDGSLTLGWFLLFAGLAVSGEVVDQVTGVLGAKKYGASKLGMVGAVIGSILGAILGTAAFPVIGSIVGVFVGCFALTFAFERLFSGKDGTESSRAGVGAVLGKAAAVAYKVGVGFLLLVFLAWRFWFV